MLEAAVEDSNQAIRQGTERLVMGVAAGAVRSVVGPGTG